MDALHRADRLIHHGQHMTMWARFLFGGIFDLVYRCGPVDPLPPRGDYILVFMAFAVMGVLFLWHLEGHTPLETQAHTFQIYSIFACVVVSLAVMVFVHDVHPAIGRAFTALLQGTWMTTLGYVLDPPLGWPIWHDDNHGETLLTQMYTWQWFPCVLYPRYPSRTRDARLNHGTVVGMPAHNHILLLGWGCV